MIEIPGFADLLSQFGPLFQPAPQQTAKPVPEAPESPAGQDTATFSRIPSDSLASTYDSAGLRQAAGPDGPVALAADGTYAPVAVQSERRFGIAFDFEFNLSVQREAMFVREPSAEGSGDRALFKALESTTLFYQSGLSSYQGNIGGGFVEARRFQTDLFYSRTRELSVQMDPALAERFGSTSRRVARTFELNISLQFSFLGQFTRQSEELSGLDAGFFEQYLNSTDALAAGSGEALQAFFDEVGRILQEAETFLQDTLGSFFQEVTETFGLTGGEAGALQDLVSGQITAFFDDVDQFLADAQTALAGFGEPGALPSPGVETTGPAVEADEAEAALV